jgi:TatD DNase family protein
MINTHCHLNDNSYNEDLDKVVKEAIDNGVKYIIVPATNPDNLEKTISISDRFENIYCAIGVHPHNASQVNDAVCDKIKSLAKHNKDKVVAIGEIGLDYYYNLSTHREQIYALNRQIELAMSVGLPVILHNRDSDIDMINELHKYSGLKGVCHCFSSDIEMASKLLEMGLYISFTANITFPKIDMSEVINNIPLNRIMLETDCPYMTPPPNRGKRNVPQNVLKVAEKISNIKNILLEEVIRMTTENAKRFFKLPILVILMFMLEVAFFNVNNLYSQSNDEYYDDDNGYEEEDPYFRKLGIGPLLGTNTFVDRFDSGIESFSYEGLFSVGALINYRFAENFIAQVAYSYSENYKLVDRLPDSTEGWIDPNYHNAIEFSIIGMVRPRNMVNFYLSLGATYFMNKLSRNFGINANEKYYFDDRNIGINGGVGAFVNFSLGNMGTIAINAEWKLGFRLDKVSLEYDPRESPSSPKYKVPTDYSTMSSVPRGGVIWYLPFFK